MTERVAIHTLDAAFLVSALGRASRHVDDIADELRPLIVEAGDLLGQATDWRAVSPLNDTAVGLQLDHDRLEWRVDYLRKADLAFDIHGRETALLPLYRRPIDADPREVAAQLAQIIDTYRTPDGEYAELHDVAELLELLRTAEHDPEWLASLFRQLGTERTFELSVAITSFSVRDAGNDGLTADLLDMRNDLATSLAIASTATMLNKQGQRVRMLDNDWFDELQDAATMTAGYIHADWVDLFDTDQPFHQDVATSVGYTALQFLAGELQSTGSFHEFHDPEHDTLAIAAHIRSPQELAATLFNVTAQHPDSAATILLAEAADGRQTIEFIVDRTPILDRHVAESFSNLAIAGTVHAQNAAILDGTVIHLDQAARALDATGSLVHAIADAEAHQSNQDPYDLIRAAGFATIVIDTIPHALRVESTNQGTYIIHGTGTIPSAADGVEVDPIDLSYVFGALFRHEELRIQIGGEATAAARELAMETETYVDLGNIGMINAALVNGLNRAGIQDAEAQQRAIDEFNSRANDIWGDATFALGFTPAGKKVVTVVSRGASALDVVGVDLQGEIIGAARGVLGPDDPTTSVDQATIAATRRQGAAKIATNQVLLAVAFEQLQAELRSGLSIDELDPSSRAILQYIEASPLNDHFERGQTSYAELDSETTRQSLSNLGQQLDNPEFSMRERVDTAQDGARDLTLQTDEFTG